MKEIMQLRNEIIEQEEKNQELQKELDETKTCFRNGTRTCNETQVYSNLTEDAEKYRMFLGKVK